MKYFVFALSAALGWAPLANAAENNRSVRPVRTQSEGASAPAPRAQVPRMGVRGQGRGNRAAIAAQGPANPARIRQSPRFNQGVNTPNIQATGEARGNLGGRRGGEFGRNRGGNRQGNVFRNSGGRQFDGGRERVWNGGELGGNPGVTANAGAERNFGTERGRNRGRGGRHQDFHDRNEGNPNFAQQHRRYHRQRQDRSWWRNRYNRFALFGGGYYYLNSGYWYPAYGYDPYYSTYAYDAPLYAYNDLDPGQVVANVQQELEQQGYRTGGVDGQFGPATRRALLSFQRDNGLPVTGEIDEPTLDALGLQ